MKRFLIEIQERYSHYQIKLNKFDPQMKTVRFVKIVIENKKGGKNI